MPATEACITVALAGGHRFHVGIQFVGVPHCLHVAAAHPPPSIACCILRLELRTGAGYQRSYDFGLIGLGAQHQRRLSRERRLEWDRRKDSANRRKHGAEATAVFDDPLSITISDPDQCRAP